VRRLTRRAAGGARRPRGLIPPEIVDADVVVLRRLTADDAGALSTAATESLEHLAPWMPWATPVGTSIGAQHERLAGPDAVWTTTSGYEYGAFLPDGVLVGGCGLHRRIGPSALEIGYWVHVDHTRAGIATACAGALTAVGFALRGVERMEIHCDEANVASAAVPPKLGYRLTGRIEHEPEAPGEVGSRLVWVLYRREWDAARERPAPDS
jgi:RimJ/RimL family protein N-acetyltransferase